MWIERERKVKPVLIVCVLCMCITVPYLSHLKLPCQSKGTMKIKHFYDGIEVMVPLH